MKKLCLFTFAVLFTFSVFAQSEKGFVYLKNGTILKGKFQYTDAGKLRVESAGNIWVVWPDGAPHAWPKWKIFRSIPVFFTAPKLEFWPETRKTASRRRLVLPEQ